MGEGEKKFKQHITSCSSTTNQRHQWQNDTIFPSSRLNLYLLKHHSFMPPPSLIVPNPIELYTGAWSPAPAPPVPAVAAPPLLLVLTAAFFLLPCTAALLLTAPPPAPLPRSSSPSPPYFAYHLRLSSNSFTSTGLIRNHFILGPVFARSLTLKP